MLATKDTGTTLTLSNACIFHRFAFFAIVIAIIVGASSSSEASVVIVRVIIRIIFGSVRHLRIIVFGVIVTLVFFSATGFRLWPFYLLLFGCRRATSEKVSKTKWFLCHFRLLFFQVNV
jgi:hypothetical protein